MYPTRSNLYPLTTRVLSTRACRGGLCHLSTSHVGGLGVASAVTPIENQSPFWVFGGRHHERPLQVACGVSVLLPVLARTAASKPISMPCAAPRLCIVSGVVRRQHFGCRIDAHRHQAAQRERRPRRRPIQCLREVPQAALNALPECRAKADHHHVLIRVGTWLYPCECPGPVGGSGRVLMLFLKNSKCESSDKWISKS